MLLWESLLFNLNEVNFWTQYCDIHRISCHKSQLLLCLLEHIIFFTQAYCDSTRLFLLLGNTVNSDIIEMFFFSKNVTGLE